MKTGRIFVAFTLLALLGRVVTGNAQTLTSLYQFCSVEDDFGDCLDGQTPGRLFPASDGSFYGATVLGGASGDGTVFRVTTAGTLTVLHNFSGPDGSDPGGVIQGFDGNFYGYTRGGGMNQSGTVFKITTAGTLTTLHNFGGGDGSEAGLYFQTTNGDLYGSTALGGTNGYGTMFRITTAGTLTTLHSFSLSDGYAPISLVQGNDGNFYGSTAYGGTNGDGTLFKMTSAGTLTTLHQFGGADGYGPLLQLQGDDGAFYGVTELGGNNGAGTVFRMTSAGTLSTLYQFCSVRDEDGDCIDGSKPYEIIRGSDGSFYGVTANGGTNDDGSTTSHGTFFKITSAGALTTLYEFCAVQDEFGNCIDGFFPINTVQGSDGSFYGATDFGGTNELGSIYNIIVALNPRANQISAIRIVGTNIVVSIPSVSGETYQLQTRNSLGSGIWSNVFGASVTDSIGGTLTLTNFVGVSRPQGFYRFDVTP